MRRTRSAARSVGRLLGGFGDCEVFSFHATKFFNTFEGGAVVTNDDELAEKIRLMRNFGFSGYDKVIYPGTNGKMTEIAAAMGLTNLEDLDEFVAINRSNYHAYRDELRSLRGIGLLQFDEAEHNNFQYIVLDVAPELSGVARSSRRSAARRERAGKKVLLAGLPQHGALPFVLSARGTCAAEHQSNRRAGGRLAYGHVDARRRHPRDRVGPAGTGFEPDGVAAEGMSCNTCGGATS